MKNWLYAVIIVAILLGAGYVLRYCTESSDLATEVPPNDTTYVYGDTLWMPSDTVWTVKWKKIPAVTSIDSFGMVTKTVTKDTTFINNKDTINVEATAEYNLSDDTFNLGLDIEHKDYDFSVVDTIKINNYIPVEVKVSDPMWIIIAVAEFILFISAGILIIIGG